MKMTNLSDSNDGRKRNPIFGSGKKKVLFIALRERILLLFDLDNRSIDYIDSSSYLRLELRILMPGRASEWNDITSTSRWKSVSIDIWEITAKISSGEFLYVKCEHEIVASAGCEVRSYLGIGHMSKWSLCITWTLRSASFHSERFSFETVLIS